MIDVRGAIDTMLFERLDGAGLAFPVFHFVPENTKPPVHVIDDVTVDNEGDKSTPLFRCSATIVSITKAPTRQGLHRAMGEVMDTLNDWQPDDVEGFTFGRLSFEASDTAIIGAQTQYGSQRFTFFAQSA